MIYSNLFDRMAAGKRVRAGIIGTGDFSTAILAQSRVSPRLSVPVVADRNVERARDALLRVGTDSASVAVCGSVTDALRALEKARIVILEDPGLMLELPIDVVVEATGDAEAGARHAQAAIAAGKHVAMVNKEADAVVGPALKLRADRAGVVYTAVDGDQHGLLMGLVTWAREIGLDVLCAGKACDAGIRFDPESDSLRAWGKTVTVTQDEAEGFRCLAPGTAGETVAARAACLGGAGGIHIHDYEELAIAANATGLLPDTADLHHPVVRTAEIPRVLCPREDGGILATRGVMDAVVELCDPHSPGLGGGVFAVVSCVGDKARKVLAGKGLVSNPNGTAYLIYRPYHLCGVEAVISILCAGLLGLPTGTSEYVPRIDAAARFIRPMHAGEVVQLADLRGLLLPARPVAPGAPLPLRMAIGQPLSVDVQPGTLLTAETVTPPSDSCLWSLRAEQDTRFFG